MEKDLGHENHILTITCTHIQVKKRRLNKALQVFEMQLIALLFTQIDLYEKASGIICFSQAGKSIEVVLINTKNIIYEDLSDLHRSGQ